MDLRWAGVDGAPPPRSYTEHEQRMLVPMLAAVTTDLVDHGLLTVHESANLTPSVSDIAVEGSALRAVLAKAENWLWSPHLPSQFRLSAPRFVREQWFLSAPRFVREQWFDDAYPTADGGDLLSWDELDVGQREVLVCAAEASGMLTGPFGIWDGPPAEQDARQRVDWIDRHLAALLPFVRDGLIEVRRYFEAASDEFMVIGVDDLGDTLTDPTLWCSDLEWGVGVGCVFTYAGLAVWRGGWSGAWNARLTFE
ncbi:MAG TPA: hypothetical protein VF054_18595 [Micromonosporaceae bacterium]